jgi:hypothetical protein
VQSGNQDYMVPVDAKIWRESDVRLQGLSLERALSDLRQAGAMIRIAVVDASRRNPFERRFICSSPKEQQIIHRNTTTSSPKALDRLIIEFRFGRSGARWYGPRKFEREGTDG